MHHIRPPTPITASPTSLSCFLAGSIEQGRAEPWQERVVAALADLDVTVLNPRRVDWDASWRQDAGDPRFSSQVSWELDGLQGADLVAVYLQPGSASPVTLLELGILTARPERVAVCCPPGFYRKGNVDIVCQRFGITQVDDLDALAAWLRAKVQARVPRIVALASPRTESERLASRHADRGSER